MISISLQVSRQCKALILAIIWCICPHVLADPSAPPAVVEQTTGDGAVFCEGFENRSLKDCGDNVVQVCLGEQCDDGNLSNNDACTNTCASASCGDSFVWSGMEACDDGNAIDNDDCTNSCAVPFCGDAIVWILGSGPEQCDDGNAIDNDDCTNTCLEAECGDGVVWDQGNGTEQCDDGNFKPKDGCSECSYDPPDELTSDEICFWASLIPDFLDQYNVPADGLVVFCHGVDVGEYSYLDVSVSSCFPHIGHTGDLFPSTLCDS